MSEASLGRASLDLDADLRPFERNVLKGEGTADSLRDTLEKLVAVANLAEGALNDVKVRGGAESRVSAQEILSGVRGIGDESREAARELDRVKLGTEQAADTVAAGDVIDHKLDEIRDNASRTERVLDRVRLARGAAIGGTSVGLLGAGIGAAALLAPAAAPAAIGLLASIPALAIAGAGALGVLALAFGGVGKAIGGDKKAFDGLTASQQQFVLMIRSLDGWLDRLKQIAAQSLFPGLTKGLKAALSPGTLNAIDTAVVELGRSLGAAGAEWGKYFGSARFQQIFGPLMQSAARNIGVLSDTFLHLFDALGVLARAAIPFTNWLVSVIDKGARFADTWLRARDATGQLAGALREARTSLTLVVRLAGSLLSVVFALGVALYPVAKVAVKLLTDGLNWLAGAIDRNKETIREIVGGALAALKQAVQIIVPVIATLAHWIDAVVRHMGGWRTAFALVISGFLAAKFVGLSRSVLGVGKSVIIAAIRIARIGSAAVAAEDLAVPAITAIGVAASAAALGGVALLTAGLIGAYIVLQKMKDALGSLPTGKQAAAGISKKWMKAHPELLTSYDRYLYEEGQIDPKTGKLVPQPGHHALTFKEWLEKYHPGALTPKPTKSDLGQLGPPPGSHAWYMKYLGYDPTTQPIFGAQPPFTKNTGSSSSGTSASGVDHHLDYVLDQAKVAVQNASAGSKAWNRAINAEENALRAEIRYWAKRAHDRNLTMAQRDAALKKELEYQKQLRALQTKTVGTHLQYVLDLTKVAVANAQQGTAEWDRAVRAEENALKAEITYWEKRADNRKLSIEARDAALKKELEYQRQLTALLKPIKQAANANEAQFVQAFKAIQNQFAPNALPADAGGGKKTDTHLYNLTNEARESNDHLKAIRDQGRFPGSQMGLDSTLAATS